MQTKIYFTKYRRFLREFRNRSKLSQAELGSKIGVQATHIGRYERGESTPTAGALSVLAKTLDTSIDYLVHGSEQAAVSTNFQDSDFLRLFKEAEKLPEDEKAVIKKMLDAFLMKEKLKQELGAG